MRISLCLSILIKKKSYVHKSMRFYIDEHDNSQHLDISTEDFRSPLMNGILSYDYHS